MASELHHSLMQIVQQRASRAFVELGYSGRFGELALTSKARNADFQCNGALAAAGRVDKGSATSLASAVAGLMADISSVVVAEVSGPGFINFRITDNALNDQANKLLRDPRHGHTRTTAEDKIILDYGGPNAAKSMHVGHLRSAVIGQALKNVLRFQGHQVIGDIHLGDWGLQMGQLINELALEQPHLPYFDEVFEGPYPATPPCTMEQLLRLYPAASERSKTDTAAREAARLATAQLQSGRRGYRALWQQFVHVSKDDIRKDYDRLGISFEQWFGESRYQDRLIDLTHKLRQMGVVTEDQGMLVVPVATVGQDTPPPLILRNSDGGFGYGATDLATIDERANAFGASKILFLVDARQSMHFEQVFRAARMSIAPIGTVELEHLAFGTVNGADGKPFRTRAGGAMQLADLIETVVQEATKRLHEAGSDAEISDRDFPKIAEIVGIGALKFGDMQHDRETNYVLDVARFTRFEGKTGPYVQYSCVRARKLLSKAAEAGLWLEPIKVASDVERELVLIADRFGMSIDQTADLRKPHILAEHLHLLASTFNRMYGDHKILAEPDRARAGSLLALCKMTLNQLVCGLALMGIAVPAAM